MIPAGISELRQAFYSHSDYSKHHACFSAHLILFYAAECGLKFVWLKRNKLLTTNQIGDKYFIERDGHNLVRWVKELRLPAFYINNIPYFKLNKCNKSYDIAKAHQAWRYGVRLNSRDEQNLLNWLNHICNWITEEGNL